MSKNNPSDEELSAILQHQYGSYGVELPDWYAQSMGMSKEAADLPPEAIMVMSKAIRKTDRSITYARSTEMASAALQAAIPVMFSTLLQQQAKVEAVMALVESWETRKDQGGADIASRAVAGSLSVVCSELRKALGQPLL